MAISLEIMQESMIFSDVFETNDLISWERNSGCVFFP